MPKSKNKKAKKDLVLVVLVVCVTVAATLVLAWMLGKEVYLSETKSVHENASNVVVNTIGAPSSLVAKLLAEKSGCQINKNTDYIERYDGKFALVNYGCNLDAKMFYKFADGTWTGLSPTNNFINGVALCSYVKEKSIPATIQTLCYDESSKKLVNNEVK
jgi:hypothetical protein